MCQGCKAEAYESPEGIEGKVISLAYLYDVWNNGYVSQRPISRQEIDEANKHLYKTDYIWILDNPILEFLRALFCWTGLHKGFPLAMETDLFGARIGGMRCPLCMSRFGWLCDIGVSDIRKEREVGRESWPGVADAKKTVR